MAVATAFSHAACYALFFKEIIIISGKILRAALPPIFKAIAQISTCLKPKEEDIYTKEGNSKILHLFSFFFLCSLGKLVACLLALMRAKGKLS